MMNRCGSTVSAIKEEIFCECIVSKISLEILFVTELQYFSVILD